MPNAYNSLIILINGLWKLIRRTSNSDAAHKCVIQAKLPFQTQSTRFHYLNLKKNHCKQRYNELLRKIALIGLLCYSCQYNNRPEVISQIHNINLTYPYLGSGYPWFEAPLNCHNNKSVKSVVWVRERTIPTEQPPLVCEVGANFCGYRIPRGQSDGSLGRILDFLDRNHYFFFQALSCTHEVKWTPFHIW
jgi:hypothetical protein